LLVPTQTNTAISKAIGVSEGTVRKAKKQLKAEAAAKPDPEPETESGIENTDTDESDTVDSEAGEQGDLDEEQEQDEDEDEGHEQGQDESTETADSADALTAVVDPLDTVDSEAGEKVDLDDEESPEDAGELKVKLAAKLQRTRLDSIAKSVNDIATDVAHQIDVGWQLTPNDASEILYGFGQTIDIISNRLHLWLEPKAAPKLRCDGNIYWRVIRFEVDDKKVVARWKAHRKRYSDDVTAFVALLNPEAELDQQYRAKLDADFNAHKAKLDADFNAHKAAYDAQNQRINAMRDDERRRYQEGIEVQRAKGLITPDEYSLVRSCVHPDSRNSVTDAKLAAAFRLFNDSRIKTLLVKEK
jgi:hypothetical protein